MAHNSPRSFLLNLEELQKLQRLHPEMSMKEIREAVIEDGEMLTLKSEELQTLLPPTTDTDNIPLDPSAPDRSRYDVVTPDMINAQGRLSDQFKAFPMTEEQYSIADRLRDTLPRVSRIQADQDIANKIGVPAGVLGRLPGEKTPTLSGAGPKISASILGLPMDLAGQAWRGLKYPAQLGAQFWMGEDAPTVEDLSRKGKGMPWGSSHLASLFGDPYKDKDFSRMWYENGKEKKKKVFDISQFPQTGTTTEISGEASVAAARAADAAGATVTAAPPPKLPQNNAYAGLGLGPDENARMKEIDKNYWMAKMMLRAGNASSGPADSYLTKSTQQLGLELDKYDRAIRLATVPKVTWYYHDPKANLAPIVLAQGDFPPAGYQSSQPRELLTEVNWNWYDTIQADPKYKSQREKYLVMADRLMNEDDWIKTKGDYQQDPDWAISAAFVKLRNRYNPGGTIPYTEKQFKAFAAAWKEEEWELIMGTIAKQNGWPPEFHSRVVAQFGEAVTQ